MNNVQALAIPVGWELFQLRNIITHHGTIFHDFLDDLIETIKYQPNSYQQYFQFKMEVLYGDYLNVKPSYEMALQIDALMDAVFGRIKQIIVQERLYNGDRFDYHVQKHSKYGVYLTKT